jgi:hypothetical protein
MSMTDSLQILDERVKADMSVALERVCVTLPPELDNYATRKFVAERLIGLVESGEHRLSELTAAARRALTELKSRAPLAG